MLASRWSVGRGPEGARRYLRVFGNIGVVWVRSEAEAERFDTKADALALAEPIAADLGVPVEVLPHEGAAARG